MISKDNRFHGHTSLTPVYKRGQAINVSQISLKTIAARPGHKYRLAVVISKKIDKSAVARNRTRRRIYEIVRKKADHLTGTNDIVINVYNERAGTMPAKELEKIIDELLVKSGLLGSTSTSEHDIVDKQKEQS